jgi:fission process protein 1
MSNTSLPAAPPQDAKAPVPDDAPVDIWRDTPLRYLGYANELGESFRPLFRSLVLPSYMVAIGYCLADTADKTSKAHQVHKETAPAAAVANGDAAASSVALADKVPVPVVHAFIDTLLWQGVASVMLPGLVINRTVWAASRGFNTQAVRSAVSPSVIKWAPTLIGLAIIPLIVHPIDEFVHNVMDCTTRKYAAKLTSSATPPTPTGDSTEDK